MEANTGGTIKKKKLAFPKPFAVMMILCLIFSLLSYVIPSSSYQMMEIEYEAADGSIATRSVVDPDTWALAEEDHSVSFMEYLTSFIRGMEAVPDIMFCIFISTAAFYIVNETGAIVAGVGRLIIKLGNKKFIIVPILGTVFTLLGATVGTYEELLCFIPILAPILIGAGYDSLLTVAVVMCSGAAGFAGAITNAFTLGVAQGIAGLPIFSGMGFHIGALVVWIITLDAILIYIAKRLEKDPKRSLMYEQDRIFAQNNAVDFSALPEFNGTRKLVLLIVLATIIVVMYGVLTYGWYFEEIAGIFMLMGFIVTVIFKKGLAINWFCDQLVAGMKDILVGAMMVGFARSILVVMEDAQMIHTILHAAVSVLEKLPDVMAVVGQYVVQIIISYIIPSGSGQASSTIPLMAPLADLTGITRQTAIEVYIISDALSNPFTPTSGNLHAGLAMAGVPWITWAKFWWKFLAIEYIVGLGIVIVADIMQIGPF